MCTQTAVYWGSPSINGYNEKSFAAAVEIPCRWEDKKELFTTNNGDQLESRAVIYVTQDVDEEGMLYLGTLDDLDSTEIDDPVSLDTAYVIKRFDKTPALRSTTEFIRKVYLTTKGMP